MKLDMVLRQPLPDIATEVAQLHAAGFDGVYTQEANADVMLPLLLAALAAPVDVYPNVAIAFPRNPMHLAYTAFDLQRVSGGRFALGLGSQIRPHIEKRFGASFGNPVAHLAELVAALRAIFRCFTEGERLEFRGDYYRHTLMTPTFIPAPLGCAPPPIWLGGLGPRMTRMAGQCADGLIVHPFNTEHYLRTVTLPALGHGLTEGGRNRDGFTVNVGVIVALYRSDEERERALQGCRSNLAFYASTPAYRVTLDAHGWGDLQPELNRLTKEGRWDDMPALIDDTVLEAVCVCGTPAEVARLMHDRYDDVADRLSLSFPYRPDPLALAELVAAR